MDDYAVYIIFRLTLCIIMYFGLHVVILVYPTLLNTKISLLVLTSVWVTFALFFFFKSNCDEYFNQKKRQEICILFSKIVLSILRESDFFLKFWCIFKDKLKPADFSSFMCRIYVWVLCYLFSIHNNVIVWEIHWLENNFIIICCVSLEYLKCHNQDCKLFQTLVKCS